MEEQGGAQGQEGGNGSGSGSSTTTTTTTEPVRSRWTPKPEQIVILESIFNSGMVNPPKEETVRIRKLLEKFGSVGDANVFYWFQNRRSRSRRRQRQMQAAAASATTLQPSQLIMPPSQPPQLGLGGAIHPHEFDGTNNNTSYHQADHYDPNNNNFSFLSSSSCGNNNMDGMSTMMNPHQLDPSSLFSNNTNNTTTLTFPQLQHHSPSPLLYPPSSSFNFHSPGLVTVFINGVATEVPRGPIDIKTMFGQDVVLVHSSGVPLPTNEFGCLMQTLQHGQSYFLVSKPT